MFTATREKFIEFLYNEFQSAGISLTGFRSSDVSLDGFNDMDFLFFFEALFF